MVETRVYIVETLVYFVVSAAIGAMLGYHWLSWRKRRLIYARVRTILGNRHSNASVNALARAITELFILRLRKVGLGATLAELDRWEELTAGTAENVENAGENNVIPFKAGALQ